MLNLYYNHNYNSHERVLEVFIFSSKRALPFNSTCISVCQNNVDAFCLFRVRTRAHSTNPLIATETICHVDVDDDADDAEDAR